MVELDDDLLAALQGRRGLPGRFFTDERLFSLERERLFPGSWWCAGLSADVAARGDLNGVTVRGVPLLLARDASGLRVFHNVCSHRGAVLVEGCLRGQARIVCPYHSWSYTLRGELAKTPHVAGAHQHDSNEFDRQSLGLREVRSAEWGGHVFVDMDGTAPPFETCIGPVAARLARVQWDQMRRDAGLARTMEVAANWKIIVENFVESYHLPWVHRKLNALNPMGEHYQILGGHSYIGQGSLGYEGDRVAGANLPMFDGWGDRARYDALYVFPNLILSPLADIIFSIILEPLSAQKTLERVEFFFAGDEAMSSVHAAARENTAGFIVDVNNEDIRIVEKVQRGRVSPAFAGGQFSRPQEATSLHLQRLIAARMLARNGQSPEDIVTLPVEDIAHPRD